jgi:hypothetical protein
MAVNRTGTGDPHLWPERSGGRRHAVLLLREEPTQSAGKKIARRRCGEEAVSGADPTSTGPHGPWARTCNRAQHHPDQSHTPVMKDALAASDHRSRKRASPSSGSPSDEAFALWLRRCTERLRLTPPPGAALPSRHRRHIGQQRSDQRVGNLEPSPSQLRGHHGFDGLQLRGRVHPQIDLSGADIGMTKP